MPDSSLHRAAENGASGSAERTVRHRLTAVAYSFGLCLAPFAVGGLIHLALHETTGPAPDEDRLSVLMALGLSLILLLLVLIPGRLLFLRNPKRVLFGTVWALILLLLGLVGVELTLRVSVPGWPASDLHGVPPEVARQAWGRVEQTGSDGINAWGQRDRPRTLRKPTGTRRIAFIGDSFLEESSSVPVSLRVEQKIGREDVEVLNLGVSATDPDEYYYRVQSVALPLQCDHCVLFVFAGNDFAAPERTLPSAWGIAAVSPRGSFLSSTGLRALNHLAMNRHRPVLRAWFAAGDLHAREVRLGELFAAADDGRMRDLLYSLEYLNLSPMQRHRLAVRLNSPEMASFFEMLRHPDQGLFRSYYLSAGLWSASVGGGQWEPLSELGAYHWVLRTHELCRDRGVEFTLVVIPEAFQVDPRMVEQWRPLTDMRTLTRSTRLAANHFLARAREEGIPAVDLHDLLDGRPGTYLNLDGHWSDHGVEVVSDFLARELSIQRKPAR